MVQTIDWIRILDQYGVEYVTRGSNVKRGNININCPFCGSADSGQHMGIDITNTGYWGCWRNETHRGKSPLRLLVELLRIPYWKAREIAGFGESYIDPDGFDAVAARVMGREANLAPAAIRSTILTLPKHFQLIDARGKFHRHLEYLIGRGFPQRDVLNVIEQYNLMGSIEHPFNDRIIIPYYVNNELVTWTARAIADAVIRYKDLSIDESLIPAKQVLYNGDVITTGGRVLLVVEGPFDAIKTDYYAQEYDVRAVAISTNNIQDEQIYILEEAVNQFDRIVFMMDNNTTGTGAVDSMRMKSKLAHLTKTSVMTVPYGRKDGGELTPREVVKLAKEINHG